MTAALPDRETGASAGRDGAAAGGEESAGCARLLLLFAGLFLLVLAARSPLIHWAGRDAVARVTRVDGGPAGPIGELRVHYSFETGRGRRQESVFLHARDEVPTPTEGDEFAVRYLGLFPAMHDRADRSLGVTDLLSMFVALLFLLLAWRPGGSRVGPGAG